MRSSTLELGAAVGMPGMFAMVTDESGRLVNLKNKEVVSNLSISPETQR